MKKSGYEIEVLNIQDKIRISSRWVKETAQAVLDGIKRRPGSAGAEEELNIVLVDNKYIRSLNRKYRHKDSATDVLSFQQEKPSRVTSCVSCADKRTTVLLGDVVISVERAASQAREYGHSFKDEIGALVAHGILHLLGYTHAEMKKCGLQMDSIAR